MLLLLLLVCLRPTATAAAAAKSLQSCLTLCDPIDGSPPGSAVPGILQARILEWVAISSSGAWKWKVKVKSLSHVRLVATPWTAADQALPSMGFSRQEYWSGVPLPSPPAVENKSIAFVCFWYLVKYCSPDVLLVWCLLHEHLSGINFQIWSVGLGSPWQVLLRTKMWSFWGAYLLLIRGKKSKLNESWEVKCHMNQLSSLWK